MKQGLSLRVSQHLALTPQLQQSIRLLQLSTMELAQEVEQMLDDNPFLEVSAEETREEFGASSPPEHASASSDDSDGDANESDAPSAEAEASWEGDGSTEV